MYIGQKEKEKSNFSRVTFRQQQLSVKIWFSSFLLCTSTSSHCHPGSLMLAATFSAIRTPLVCQWRTHDLVNFLVYLVDGRMKIFDVCTQANRSHFHVTHLIGQLRIFLRNPAGHRYSTEAYVSPSCRILTAHGMMAASARLSGW